MDARLVVLKLFLDELGVPTDIETLDDRKRVQKAVYLGQLAPVDLSYRFSWYKMGPYSPALTSDYYSLAEAIASGDTDYQQKELHGAVRQRLQRVRPLLTPPVGVALSPEDWLELVASLHYLRRVSKYDPASAAKTLMETKPHLSPYADQAEEKLRALNLV